VYGVAAAEAIISTEYVSMTCIYLEQYRLCDNCLAHTHHSKEPNGVFTFSPMSDFLVGETYTL